ncbi:uncharacterized protein LOC111311492 isoform X2 [Durio zibethinus]|uniref:Uncharacterized protein LOC111311492 isoform X2 n=1 Tax=Durio zibethinus TaxID=66656 RepID=A0A6P6APE0_DURZI|nr:uncharacterized protein LOC111311492 isoform X2 [Durio zibethinus]
MIMMKRIATSYPGKIFQRPDGLMIWLWPKLWKKKGKMWVTMGMVHRGNAYCSIEETLFFIEIGALHLLDENGICLSLKELYEKFSDGKSGCYWELFEVYRHLKFLMVM